MGELAKSQEGRRGDRRAELHEGEIDHPSLHPVGERDEADHTREEDQGLEGPGQGREAYGNASIDRRGREGEEGRRQAQWETGSAPPSLRKSEGAWIAAETRIRAKAIVGRVLML